MLNETQPYVILRREATKDPKLLRIYDSAPILLPMPCGILCFAQDNIDFRK